MRIFRLSCIGLALVALATASLWAQDEATYPEAPEWDPANVVPPEISGVFNVMKITTRNVPWNGTGSVSIPFTTNQRGTVWLVVYKKGSTEIGARGPLGAWLRLEPQDLYINHTSGQAVESGNNTITWNGLDFEGKAAGPGNYEFDVIGINTLDKVSLAAPGTRYRPGWNETSFDLKQDPPEVWVNRERFTGTTFRGTLGTDYLANPTAYEEWSYANVFLEGWGVGNSLGGMKPDDVDTETYWMNVASGEEGGTYKMKINRGGKSWDRDESFGENGWAPNKEDRNVGFVPYKDIIYQAHWSRVDNPATAIEVWDKTSGQIIRAFDTNDFFTQVQEDESIRNLGPAKMDANVVGIWASSWAGDAPIVFLDHDGNIVWANQQGDGIGQNVSNEEAAVLGVPANVGNTIYLRADGSGKVLFITEAGNDRGAEFAFLGRDGTGLADVFMAPGAGPFRNAWTLNVISADSPYDGIYINDEMDLITRDYARSDEGITADNAAEFGPGMTLFIPYDVESGRLGAGITVVEEVESASTPSSYALGQAYPNPFNPETTIEFTVPTDGYVKIVVFNAAGQLVNSLVDEELSAGGYKTTWDARDQNGQELSSGVYFIRMQASDFAATRSVTLLK